MMPECRIQAALGSAGVICCPARARRAGTPSPAAARGRRMIDDDPVPGAAVTVTVTVLLSC